MTKFKSATRWRSVLAFLSLVNASVSQEESFGLTAYGEPCTDPCDQRGFPYAWCHKKPSRNGTWIDRDYCSPRPGQTRYLEPCLSSCHQSSLRGPFFWCQTAPTPRGDWDYCSPFPIDACAWSAWGPWSDCTLTCGPKTSTKTRRRRLEMADGSGRVGACSGAIEQSISLCEELPDCKGKESVSNFVSGFRIDPFFYVCETVSDNGKTCIQNLLRSKVTTEKVDNKTLMRLNTL